MIKVVNKRTHTPTAQDVYIGNPYSHKQGTKASQVVQSVEEAIELRLASQIKTKNKEVIKELKRIYKQSNKLVMASNWVKVKQAYDKVKAMKAEQRNATGRLRRAEDSLLKAIKRLPKKEKDFRKEQINKLIHHIQN